MKEQAYLGQNELLHWFVPHPFHHGPWTDATESSRDHCLLHRHRKISFCWKILTKVTSYHHYVCGGGAAVTSWSSWRSFTVTLLWNSGQGPLGNTPSLVMTTGWSTLKSSAMADTSEGVSTEGPDTFTRWISSFWPATWAEVVEITAKAQGDFITTPTASSFYSTRAHSAREREDVRMGQER